MEYRHTTREPTTQYLPPKISSPAALQLRGVWFTWATILAIICLPFDRIIFNKMASCYSQYDFDKNLNLVKIQTGKNKIATGSYPMEELNFFRKFLFTAAPGILFPNWEKISTGSGQ